MENARALERRGLCATIHEMPLGEEVFNKKLEHVFNDNQMTDQLQEYQLLCRQHDALSIIANDFS